MKKVSVAIGIAIFLVVIFVILWKNVEEGEEYTPDLLSLFIPILPTTFQDRCHFGLTRSVVTVERKNGECLISMSSMGGGYVCTQCGNGICGKGENYCNCVTDCKIGEGELREIPKPVLHKTDDFDGAIKYQ